LECVFCLSVLLSLDPFTFFGLSVVAPYEHKGALFDGTILPMKEVLLPISLTHASIFGSLQRSSLQPFTIAPTHSVSVYLSRFLPFRQSVSLSG
jgi:hypothetical protein